MRRFQIKGGYGEHDRSCFLVEYGSKGSCYMVDCGIMDSDSFPYPDVSSEELAETDYLFLTHCHKDHCGAFERLVEQGFRGVLVTTQMTLTLSQINYSNTIILPTGFMNGAAEFSLEGITLNYGRSGHCPGGIWLSVQGYAGECFLQRRLSG